jgi:hypothetical protein
VSDTLPGEPVEGVSQKRRGIMGARVSFPNTSATWIFGFDSFYNHYHKQWDNLGPGLFADRWERLPSFGHGVEIGKYEDG